MENKIYKKNISWRVRKLNNKYFLMCIKGAFELNDMGYYIWNKINGEYSVEQIINDIANEYSESKSEISKDVLNFCNKLEEKNTIIRV